MNILLTNHSLDFRGGSETWIITMFNHLSIIHNVDVFTALGNTLTKTSFNKNKHYDLVLINHSSCMKAIAGWNIDIRIFTCHGVIPNLERPIAGANAYVAISEETQLHSRRCGFNARIIRNPIDPVRFKYSPANKTLQKILYLNNRPIKKELLQQACCKQELRVVSCLNIDPLSHILWADLVISAGRGCYESLSCGKNVIILNRGLLDGIVTKENIGNLRRNNCSGRYHSKVCSSENLSAELAKYDPGRNLRPYILENNNVTQIAEEYLSVYKSVKSGH